MIGTVGVDAFGHTPVFEDKGIRKRALLAVGKVDYGEPCELLPMEKGVTVEGVSGDHTIVDVQDAERDFKVGDIMEFDVTYITMTYLTNCRGVHIAYV